MDRVKAEQFVRSKFAEFTGVSEEQLFAAETTLSAVVNLSPKMTNSIDLMEAFARTANALRKEHGVRIRLPALPLDTPTSMVLTAFLDEYERQAKQAKEAVS